MTLYAIWATDAPGQQEARQQARPAHRQRLREPGQHPIKVVLAGPTLDSQNQMNGTLLIVEADSQDHVKHFIEEDPYTLAGVYQSIEIRPYACGLGPLARMV
jgi:uncharacterized protein